MADWLHMTNSRWCLTRVFRLVLVVAAFVWMASWSPLAAGLDQTAPLARLALTTGQHPFAMVLSCADSHVPPEYIFNAGLGDLFVVRAAGEVVDKSVMASLEYELGSGNVVFSEPVGPTTAAHK